jgi:hypothetical protein
VSAEAPPAPTRDRVGRARGAAPWVAVALLGLVTQTLARTPSLFAGDGDGASYAALARIAPARGIYDDRPYVLHPPLHPLLIRAVAVAGGLPCDRAGVVLAGLSTIALGLLTFGLTRRALGSTAGALVAAALLLASRGAVVLGQGPWREPLQTLVAYGLLAAALVAPPGRRSVAAAAVLAALAGLLWDPLVWLVAPLAAAGLWLRRPAALVAAGVLLAVWLGWAVQRQATIGATPDFPAGIDGLVEETARGGPGAFFNPNLYPRTAAHNAFFWPAALTPLRPFELAAPWFVDEELPHLGYPPGAGTSAAALLLVGVALGGVVLLARRRPADGPGLLALAAGGLLLGAPACLGLTPRYGYAWLPTLFGLAGAVVAALAGRADPGERRAVPAALLLLLALAGVWAVGHRHGAWTRPQRFDGAAVAALLAGRTLEPVLPASAGIAAPVGLVPDLVWLLPGRRIVTLPLDAAVEAHVVGRAAPLVVVPRALAPLVRPGVAADVAELAQGIPALRAVHAAAAAGKATHLGVLVEGEVTDRARVRSWDVFWWTDAARGAAPGVAAPPPFGLLVEPGAGPAIREALAAQGPLPGVDPAALEAALSR